jgi:Flp pilus assembly secretin CpaC
MKLFLLTVSLMVILSGCSRSSHTPAGTSKTNDLGKVVVADRSSYDYALSGNRNCRVSLTALQNQEVMVELVVLETNLQGAVKILARPSTVTKMGERVSMAVGEESVSLIPEAKPPAN